MRIRSTKPEFWRSSRVASVSWSARLVLKGLESYVDDNGVGKDDLALIVGDVFSRDMLARGSETVAKVSEAISELHQAGLVWRYEAEGTDLLFISFWESIQRIDKPGKGRFPRPDGTWAYNESQIRESVASPREIVAPGTGEQGNRGTGEETLSSDKSDQTNELGRFEEFWNTYGKKVGKKKAEQRWRVAVRKPGVTPDLLIAAAADYVAWVKSEGKFPDFVKDPATWLLGEHWTDERSARHTTPRPTLVHSRDLERPPSGLSDQEYAEWEYDQRQKRGQA